MVTFNAKFCGGLERVDIIIDGVLRFHAIKDLTEWNVWSLNYKKLIKKCINLTEIETYVEEMDK